ncbi:MAG: tetratricopeptide repeat protein [Promethearchaeia archaeon]
MKKNHDDVFKKGKNLIVQGKYEEAIDYFSQLQEEEPEKSTYTNYLGIIYLSQEDYKKAAEYFKKSIEMNPENWYSYYKLGEICKIKQIDKCAIDYFTETIEHNPRNLNAFLNLAMIFQRSDSEIAQDILQNALKIEPDSNLANYMLALIYLKNKKYKDAEEHLNNIITKKPEFLDGMAQYKLGAALLNQNKVEKARKAIQEAIKISKKAKYLNFLGLTFLSQLDLEKAKQYFKDAIKLDAENPSPWINLGDTYFKQDDIESAKKCLKEAIELVKNDNLHRAVWINYANCFEKEQKLSHSLYCLNKALQQSEDALSMRLNFMGEDEDKMKTIHEINQKINRLKEKGIEAICPPELKE